MRREPYDTRVRDLLDARMLGSLKGHLLLHEARFLITLDGGGNQYTLYICDGRLKRPIISSRTINALCTFANTMARLIEERHRSTFLVAIDIRYFRAITAKEIFGDADVRRIRMWL